MSWDQTVSLREMRQNLEIVIAEQRGWRSSVQQIAELIKPYERAIHVDNKFTCQNVSVTDTGA